MVDLVKRPLRRWLKNYLWAASQTILTDFHGQVMVVTGSIAKTSTKEAIRSVLSSKFGDQLWAAPGNLNTMIGIPLALLGYKHQPKWFEWLEIFHRLKSRAKARRRFFSTIQLAIFELAADEPGDFHRMLGIIQPDVSIITAIGPAHLASFVTLDRLVEEKTEVLRALIQNGTAILPKRDRRLLQTAAKNCRGRLVWFSAELPEIAETVAAVVGRLFKINRRSTERSSLTSWVDHRFHLKPGYHGSLLIDDSYNANPLSMESALQVLQRVWRQTGRRGRKIAVLGDMLELGSYTEQAHRRLGEQAARVADLVIGIGQLTRPMSATVHFDSATASVDYLKKVLKPSDVVLIKGSHGVGLARLVEMIQR